MRGLRRILAVSVAILIVCNRATFVSAAEDAQGGRCSADGGKYLLLDSRVVERAEGVRLTLGVVEKDSRNPLFVEDKPWEVRFDNLYANVIYDEGEKIYKCWYNPFIIDEVTSSTPPEKKKVLPYRPKKREMGICYATSRDGIAWVKPDLGIIEFNGSKKNNLVMRHIHGTGVRKDLHDPDPSQRYKAFMQKAVATSPDGLHWSAAMDCPGIQAAGDTHNNTFWDARCGKYVGITRLWDKERLVGRTVSDDFRKWSKAVEVLRGTPEHQTYAMITFPYANVYLGLVMVLHTKPDTVDCELAWSPNTIEWHRVRPGKPLIPLGPKGSFDWGCVYAAAYPVMRDGRIRLYYGGGNDTHMSWRKTGLGLAYLRVDGFAGMATEDATAGSIVTKPLECRGKQLRINVDARHGSLGVTALTAEGRDLARADAIKGDQTDGLVTWQDEKSLAGQVGKEIRLRFELRAATLYAFRFADR